MNQFSATFFAGNRERLCSVLPDCLILISAHSALQESADLAFPFRQDSNFWYLTGLNEPDAVLVINTRNGDTNLMLPDQNDYQKEWDGELNTTQLKTQSGIKTFIARSGLATLLKQSKKEKLQVCYLAPLPELVEPYCFYSNPARRLLEHEIKEVIKEPKDVRLELAKLRQIKQPIELQAIQEAIDVTGKTLESVKNRLSGFKTEKDIERAISAGFFEHGSDGHAYTPIVANGRHAATIHYTGNNSKLEKNSLLLLDVGAKVNGYASDISRTWALGKPSERQKEVFVATLELQEIAFGILKPGVMLKEYQKTMEGHASEILKKLGVKPSKYPHGFSHFLGLDVHDAGDYQSPLEEGSVLTIEPGIYLGDEAIGVRIEDDVLVTKNGCKSLSNHISKLL